MARSVRHSPYRTEHGAPETDEHQSKPSPSLADHLQANPGIVVEDLREQISGLIDALIDARSLLEGPNGATRQEIVLDLYDEELASKRDAVVHGGFAPEEFWDAVFARRDARKTANQ